MWKRWMCSDLYSLDVLRNADPTGVQRDIHRDLRANVDVGQPAEVVLRVTGTTATDHQQSYISPTVDHQLGQDATLHACLYRLHARSLLYQ